MTRVLLVCDGTGVFRSCVADGHAGYSRKGSDIVCAGISIMLETAVKVLESNQGIEIKADFSSRGAISFCAKPKDGVDSVLLETLRCTAGFIRISMRNLSETYPENVQFYEISED